MASLPFFKFDAEAWLTGKIQALSIEQVGIYINLVARIWKAGGELKRDRFLPRLIGCTEEQLHAALSDFADLGIMSETDGALRVKFLDEQLDARREFLERCSAGGSKRAARYGQASGKVTSRSLVGHLKVTSSDLEGNFKVPPSNTERRKKIEDIQKEEKRECESARARAREDGEDHTPGFPQVAPAPVPNLGYPQTPQEVMDKATMAGIQGATIEEAEAFLDYYSSRGWLAAAGVRIINWQASFKSWLRKSKEIGAKNAGRKTGPVGGNGQDNRRSQSPADYGNTSLDEWEEIRKRYEQTGKA